MYSTIFDNTLLIDCMQEVILPHLVREKGEAPLRLWSVGCGIGDEALMLASLLTPILRLFSVPDLLSPPV